jgi:hypothetical protein
MYLKGVGIGSGNGGAAAAVHIKPLATGRNLTGNRGFVKLMELSEVAGWLDAKVALGCNGETKFPVED